MNITFLEMLHKIRQARQIILNNYRNTQQSIWRPPLHQFWSDLEAFRTKYYQKAGLETSAEHYRFIFGRSKVGISVQKPIKLIECSVFSLVSPGKFRNSTST